MSIAITAPQTYTARSTAATADYWALTKPEINFLIAIVTFAAFTWVCLLTFIASPSCC